LALCKPVDSSPNKHNLFYKNTLEVVPYPILIFGATTVPVVTHYIEIYNAKPMHAYTVSTEIFDSEGRSIRKKTKQRTFKHKDSIEVGTTPVTAYQSGKYNFRFSLLDSSGNEVIKTDKYFFIYNPHLHALLDPLAHSKASFDSLSDEQLNHEFEVARYVATELEMEMFKQLESVGAKSKFMYEFWLRTAEGRGEFPPIMRNEYLARVEGANARYRSMGKDGWQTDRGRIFLIYAQPDEIERIPSESDSKPYEVWRYFKIESGVEFVFVDRGYSGLELVHSTKRGEFMDDGWRRYLQ
ncbi:GWxTD domain-containing protein, partial [candidate division KSB1 bacterium]|nr:GWxTD domain-containing protein [candidate division KSB1 bacterium]